MVMDAIITVINNEAGGARSLHPRDGSGRRININVSISRAEAQFRRKKSNCFV